MGLIDQAKSDNSGHIKLMFGGESVEVQVDNTTLLLPECNGPGRLYVQPTIYECMNADIEIACEEIFGPVVCVFIWTRRPGHWPMISFMAMLKQVTWI
jgi:hypothetical protein